MSNIRHSIKKFWQTLRIAARTVMARTFGEYAHSGWNGQCDYARYRWRGHDYFIQITPAKPREPAPLGVPLRRCRGCGSTYHPGNEHNEVMAHTNLAGHCPDCIGAT